LRLPKSAWKWVKGAKCAAALIGRIRSDVQWAVIAPHCLGRDCDPGRTGPDPRLFVEAVLWIARTGCPWHDLPEESGTWNTVFNRFRIWVKADAFYHMIRALAEDADFEYAIIDVSMPAPPVRAGMRKIVKVHRHGQGEKGGLKAWPSDAPAAA
jgi:transposase